MKQTVESFDVGYVVWGDANRNMSNDSSHDVRHGTVSLVTAGIIVRNDPTGVTVVSDFAEDGAFRHPYFIPRVNIKSVKILARDVVSRAPQTVVFPAEKRKKVDGKEGRRSIRQKRKR